MTQAQLAAAVGVTQATVSGWEATERNHRPSYEDSASLAAYFNVPVMWLIYGTKEQETDEAREIGGYMDVLDQRGKRELLRIGRTLVEEFRAEQASVSAEALEVVESVRGLGAEAMREVLAAIQQVQARAARPAAADQPEALPQPRRANQARR